jgi:hypothetical protein
MGGVGDESEVDVSQIVNILWLYDKLIGRMIGESSGLI